MDDVMQAFYVRTKIERAERFIEKGLCIACVEVTQQLRQVL